MAVLCLHCYTWTFSGWGAQASHCCGFSCCRAQTLERSGFSTYSSWALECELSGCGIYVSVCSGTWCTFLIYTITLYLWKFSWVVSFYTYSILFYFLGWGGTSNDVLVGSFCVTSLSNPFKLFFSSLDSAYFSHDFSVPYQTFSIVSSSTTNFAFIPETAECCFLVLSRVLPFYFVFFCCLVITSSELLGLYFAFSFHRSRYVIKFLNSWHNFHLLGENIYSGHPHFCTPFFLHHL